MIYLFALLCVISNWSTEVHEVSIATDMENVPLCTHIHKMEIYTGILIGFFTVCFQTTLVYKTSNSQAEGEKILREFMPSITICNEYQFSSQTGL